MSNAAAFTMKKMIQYFGRDAKRINHALKVYSFSKSIGELEGISDWKLEALEIAAILHDIGIKESERKYGSSSGKYQEMEGPPVARELLEGSLLTGECVDRICYLIGNHHTYSKIDDIDFQILVEADFLVNIFENRTERKEIESIRQKYFKTGIGICYLEKMYL